MRRMQSAITLISALAILMLPAPTALAQNRDEPRAEVKATTETNVTLSKPSWQTVLDKLFGAPESGLLDGKNAFRFTANDLQLTSEQAAAFFTSSATSMQDFAALIDAATALHGQVRLNGTIDGERFGMKLAGREIKLEGVTLTAAQREALIADLRDVSGLKQVKIDGLIDGRETRIILAGDKERLSLVRGERPENRRDEDRKKLDRPQKIEIDHRGKSDQRVEIDRGVRADTRIEREGRVRVDKVEKPEVPRSGK